MHAREARSAVAPAGRRHPRAAGCDRVPQLPPRKHRDAPYPPRERDESRLANLAAADLLHDLCSGGKRGQTSDAIERARILLDAGASLSARDEEYRSTPLAWAARTNMPEMVEFLLARGAPTNLPDDPTWAAPLAWAERRGHAEVAEILRKHGA